MGCAPNHVDCSHNRQRRRRPRSSGRLASQPSAAQVRREQPLLWARIDIRFPFKRIDMHLERSADVPLTVDASLPFLSTYKKYHERFCEGGNRIERFCEVMIPHTSDPRPSYGLQLHCVAPKHDADPYQCHELTAPRCRYSL